MIAASDAAATQALTFAIPLGVARRRAPLGLLPATTNSMTDGAALARPREQSERWRVWCLGVCRRGRRGHARATSLPAPPRIGSTAQRCSSRSSPSRSPPWSPWLHPGACWALPAADSPANPHGSSTGWPNVGAVTVSSPGHWLFIVADLCVVVAWHAPGAVASVARHGWMVPLEGVSLLLFGLGLWLELVASPPLAPRSGYLRRAVLAAFVDVGILDPRLRGRALQPRLLPQLPPRLREA